MMFRKSHLSYATPTAGATLSPQRRANLRVYGLGARDLLRESGISFTDQGVSRARTPFTMARKVDFAVANTSFSFSPI